MESPNRYIWEISSRQKYSQLGAPCAQETRQSKSCREGDICIRSARANYSLAPIASIAANYSKFLAVGEGGA